MSGFVNRIEKLNRRFTEEPKLRRAKKIIQIALPRTITYQPSPGVPSKVWALDGFYWDTRSGHLPSRWPLGLLVITFHARVKTAFVLITNWNTGLYRIPYFGHQTVERKSHARICQGLVVHCCLFVCHVRLNSIRYANLYFGNFPSLPPWEDHAEPVPYCRKPALFSHRRICLDHGWPWEDPGTPAGALTEIR